MQIDSKDKIFAEKTKTKDFIFDKKVADVFDDMLVRSVPFYEHIQRMIIELSGDFCQPQTAIYDLGCSTGTTLALLSGHIKDPSVKFIGVDNSQPMLDKSRQRFAKLDEKRASFVCGDLNSGLSFDAGIASVILMNWTLQFVRPINRDKIVKQIADSLMSGGCLIVVEKVMGPHSLLNRLYIEHYFDFKRSNGYTEMEISQKREALENVLIPYTIDENKELFVRNGFGLVDLFFRWYNFAGFICLKV